MKRAEEKRRHNFGTGLRRNYSVIGTRSRSLISTVIVKAQFGQYYSVFRLMFINCKVYGVNSVQYSHFSHYLHIQFTVKYR